MVQKHEEYDDDDGRVICSMDVDGMRWHDKRAKREERERRKSSAHEGARMTKSEARAYMNYSLLAGLVVASTFSIGWILFTLFCTEIWFK